LTFGLSGAAAAAAGTLFSARLLGGSPAAGDRFLLLAIAVVVVGGTALTGGSGGIVRTMLGALIMTVLVNGMSILGVDPSQQPDSGELWLRGRQVTLRSVRDATRLGVSMVSQEQSLLPNISVAENIFLGHESRFVRFGTINWGSLRAAARVYLGRVGSQVDP